MNTESLLISEQKQYCLLDGFRNTLSQDPYNWGFPKKNAHNATMYLSTIRAEDVGYNVYSRNPRAPSTLSTDGIEKAQPKPAYDSNYKKFINSTRNDDIEKSQPSKLHQFLNKEYYCLRTDDLGNIKKKIFTTTRKPSNPSEPVYKLQSFQPIPPPNQKFVRDSISVDDIEKAKPTPMRQYKFQRETNYIADIEGSRAKKDYERSVIINHLNVTDINLDMQFKTKRLINPLDPRYVLSNENREKYEYGEIIDAKSKRLHPVKVNKLTDFSLHTDDIEGGFAGTKGNKAIISKTRTEWLNPTEIADIPGAQKNTLKRGIITKRCVNPNDPKYVLPGCKEFMKFDRIPSHDNKETVHTKKIVSHAKDNILTNDNELTLPPVQVERKKDSPPQELSFKPGKKSSPKNKNAESIFDDDKNSFIKIRGEEIQELVKEKKEFSFEKSKHSFYGVDDKTKPPLSHTIPGAMKRDHVIDEKKKVNELAYELKKNKIIKSKEEAVEDEYRFTHIPKCRVQTNAEKLDEYLNPKQQSLPTALF